MTLGEKIKQARLEAGLSQRQLCGSEVTRNMLSQIENGTARPSMDKLRYFASRLGKPVSYFLDEESVSSPNQALMAEARKAVLAGRAQEAAQILKNYRQPDETFDAEFRLLQTLSALAQARDAIDAGKLPMASQLLENLGPVTGYCSQALERERMLLLAKASPRRAGVICAALPSLDEELLLRGQIALDAKRYDYCRRLLDASLDQENPHWNFLKGQLLQALGQFEAAALCYHKAEHTYPEKCVPRLELCYRELGNFKLAYEYACKQK